MKKLTTILILALLLVVALTTVACDDRCDHNIVIDPAVPATCTTAGHTEGQHCDICFNVFNAPEEIASLGHIEVIDEAVPSTCTTTGLTEGKHCSTCGEILVQQEVVEMHTAVTTPAVPATCTEAGLTSGKHCSVCGEILEEQNAIQPIGHKFETFNCSRCNTSCLGYKLNDTKDGYEVYGIETVTASGKLVIPDTYNDLPVTAICDNAFDGWIGMEEITFPESVTTIGNFAFMDCKNLTSAGVFWVMDSQLCRIGNGAFYGCESLSEISIPASVTAIGYSAFYGCDNLNTVMFAGTIEQWLNLTNYDSHFVRSLDDYDLYIGGNRVEGELIIPYGVTTIGCYAFYNLDSLTNIKISAGVTTIGTGAFYDCDSLTSVTIGNSVTTIGEYAFSGCDNLTSVTMWDSVTTIGNYAFNDCNSLTDVNYIGDVAGWCGITFFGAFANPMYYADNLYIGGNLVEGELIIPDSVTNIGNYAFYDCDSLTSVTFGENNQLIRIRPYAFYGCEGLTSITIPDEVSEICPYAFSDCTSLTSVKILSGVFYIDNNSFKGCTSLASIEIPASVTTIGEYAFYGCDSLKDVHYLGTEEEWNAITIPEGNDQLTATIHCIEIIDAVAPTCTSTGLTEGKRCPICNEVFVEQRIVAAIEHSINENGDCDNCDFSCLTYELMAYEDEYKIIDVDSRVSGDLIIPETYNGKPVTAIGDNAFRWCNDLTGITIPRRVESIGNYAFANCTSLTSVTFGENSWLDHIGNYAFSGCESLTSIEIPNELNTDVVLGDHVFQGCTSLKSFTTGGIWSISSYAFYGCNNLTSIVFSRGLRDYQPIGSYAFYGCDSLTDVYYAGTKAQWSTIPVGDYNEALANATIHYNYVPEEN